MSLTLHSKEHCLSLELLFVSVIISTLSYFYTQIEILPLLYFPPDFRDTNRSTGKTPNADFKAKKNLQQYEQSVGFCTSKYACLEGMSHGCGATEGSLLWGRGVGRWACFPAGGGVHKVQQRTTGESTGKKKNRKWGRIQMRHVTDIVYRQQQWGKGDFKKHVDRKKSFYLKI